MGRYKLSNEAKTTLEKIYQYSLENFGEKKADQYFLSLHSTFKLLANNPKIGRVFYAYRRHEHAQHICFYKETGYGILVLHILHVKEDIAALL